MRVRAPGAQVGIDIPNRQRYLRPNMETGMRRIARKIRQFLRTEEHVMCDAWQEEDVIHAVYHQRAEEEAHHPPLVLFDVCPSMLH